MQGATVVDFAYHVHTDVGNQMFGAKVNGKVVHASHALANAEVVEVLTYDGRPSRGSIERHQVRRLPHTVFTTRKMGEMLGQIGFSCKSEV